VIDHVIVELFTTTGKTVCGTEGWGTPVAAYNCQGPADVIDQGVTGFMAEESEGLRVAVDKCLQLDRDRVHRVSQRWSWQRAWEIFRDNLVPMK